MIEIKAPHDYSAYKNKPSVFLAGSIEMGTAIDWQARIVAALSSYDVLVLNPRRSHWDPTWDQSLENPQFVEQVKWEMDALDAASHVFLYFVPETKSPITLMELGVHAATNPEKLTVCCPMGYWRKGNVDFVCQRYGVKMVSDIDAMIASASGLFKKAA